MTAPAPSGRDDPTRLFARFRAIILSAFIGLAVVAGVMIALSVDIEVRRERQVLTELLRSHAYLLDSQAAAFRRFGDLAGERIRARFGADARTGAGPAAASCAGAEELSAPRLAPRFAEGTGAIAARTPRDAEISGEDWAEAVASISFIATEIDAAAPNLARLAFVAPDGRAAAWRGAAPDPAAAKAMIAPAACAANPAGAPLWIVTRPAADGAAPANGAAAIPPETTCASGPEHGAIRLLQPVDIGARRAGYLALDLDLCAIRRMNSDLAIDFGHAFLAARGDMLIGAPRSPAPLARLTDADWLGPAARRAVEDAFALPAGDLIEAEGDLLFAQRLSAAPWTMIAVIDATAQARRATGETGGRLAVLLALIAVAFAMTVALTRREFIDPARALVADIVARGSGKTPPDAAPPPGWRPYFERIRSVFQENTDAAALRRELSIAARMQASILPRRFPGPEAPLDIRGAALPAREIGGDFYDFFDLPDGRIALVIADVSGKGVPAALFMVLARTLTRAAAAAADGAPPADCVAKVNLLLSAENPETMFVTLFYGVFEPATGALRYANAGHNPPYVIAADGAIRPLTEASGPALGVFEEAEYTEGAAEIAPGETLLLYTDGVTEAMDPADQEYGEARFETLLKTLAATDPAETLRRIEVDVDAFAAGAPQADDLTVMAARRRRLGPLTAALGSDLTEIPAFAARLESWGREQDLPDAAIHAISLSLDELMTNAMSYGAPGEEDSAAKAAFRIDVTVSREDDRLVADLRDNGRAFDPLGLAPPDLESPAASRAIGGLGIHFARTLTDAQTYRRDGDRNIVTLTKSLEGDVVP